MYLFIDIIYIDRLFSIHNFVNLQLIINTFKKEAYSIF